MALVISPIGVVSILSEDRGCDAVWNEGCIQILQRAESVIISVDFERLTEPAIAAALYELADMRPKKICLTARGDRTIGVLVGFKPAFKRVCEIFANANNRENGSDIPWLPGSTGLCFQVKHQSNLETYKHVS